MKTRGQIAREVKFVAGGLEAIARDLLRQAGDDEALDAREADHYIGRLGNVAALVSEAKFAVHEHKRASLDKTARAD